MARRIKVRNFNINDADERQECEDVLSKYGQLGLNTVMKHETCFHPRNGIYYVAVHWAEDIPEDEHRD